MEHNVKQFSIFSAPLNSFFSKQFYYDVAHNWKGVCFIYLFLLLGLCWLPMAVKAHIGFAGAVEKEIPEMLEQLPDISINNGAVTVDVEQPYYIRDEENNNEVVVIIDTTGQITSLEDTTAKILLTKHTFIVEKSQYETRSMDLKEIEEFRLTKEIVLGWFEFAVPFIGPAIFIICFCFALCFRVCLTLFYSIFGLFMAQAKDVTISYGALLRLVVISMTPAILLITIFDLTASNPPVEWLWMFIMSMGYLFFGITASNQAPPVHEYDLNIESSQD